MDKYFLIYNANRGSDDTWTGTLEEYEKFSAELDEEFSEDGWSMISFSKLENNYGY